MMVLKQFKKGSTMVVLKTFHNDGTNNVPQSVMALKKFYHDVVKLLKTGSTMMVRKQLKKSLINSVSFIHILKFVKFDRV